MEHRELDDEELRKIKVKRNVVGGIEDAVEGDGEETEDSEIVFDLPEELGENEEYDEDLVGLTPSQLKKELERREKAAEEAAKNCAKLLEEGDAAYKEGNLEEAETFYMQALLYDPDNVQVQNGLWICRTRNFSDDSVFYSEEMAEEFSTANAEVKAMVRERVGARLKKELEEAEREAQPLRETVTAGQAERRSAFAGNRKYYFIRTCIAAIIMLLMIVGIAVSAYFIVRTTTNVPVILTGVFGGLTFLSLVVTLVIGRKLLVAQRLCSENERTSSTEDGERLVELEETIASLRRYLED
ncbi:MAG: hypothetical protein K2L87_00840 [Clostridiales bacterium]|nr:hypothetical protein [Clostridiales bacterium]